MNARLPQIVGMVLLFGIGPLAHGATIKFQQDVSPAGSYQSNVATLNEVNPSSHGGTGQSNYIGHSASGNTGAFRSLEAFDISAIPAGLTINSLTLTLYPRTSTVSGTVDANFTVELHQLIGTATEAGVSWDNRYEDDVNDSLDVPWSTPGGDYESTVLSTFDANPDSLVTSTFPSTSALVGAAQGALDGSGTLYLLALSPDAEAESNETRMNFASDEYDTASSHPLLTIDYTAPVVLEVNTLTGIMQFADRTAGVAWSTYYYRISGEVDSLDPVNWNSLDDQNFDAVDGNDSDTIAGDSAGEGWDEAGGVSTSLLGEARFTSSSTITPGETLSLGAGYNASEDKRGLTFEYFDADTDILLQGDVKYVVPGDMNDDGNLTELDVPLFIQALVNRAAYESAYPNVSADLVGDFDGNGLLDTGDIAAFSLAVSNAAATNSSSVPEPTSALLFTLATCFVVGSNRKRRPLP